MAESNLPAQEQTPNPEQASKLVSAETRFIGPLPPPSLLRDYDLVCPGAGERIIAMTEEQGRHRREIEKTLAAASVEEMRRNFMQARIGQVFAFLVSLGFLSTGAYVSVSGQPWVGALLGAMGISGIVGSFLNGPSERKTQSPPPVAEGKSKKK